jgi:hypothetical protein
MSHWSIEPPLREKIRDGELESFLSALNTKNGDSKYLKAILRNLLKKLMSLKEFLKVAPWRLHGAFCPQVSDFLLKMCAREAGWHLGLLYRTCSKQKKFKKSMENLRQQLLKGV